MHDNENNIPTWGFTYRDIDGAISTKSFDAISWTRALQEFVYFLKGTGFNLDDDSIQIKDKHRDDFNWFGYICPPIEQENPVDWEHPDDTDLSMHFCPPFEGDPNDCAFRHEPTLKDLKDSVDALTLEISALNYYKEKEMQEQQAEKAWDKTVDSFIDSLRYTQGEQV
jgi:hypothetical protein